MDARPNSVNKNDPPTNENGKLIYLDGELIPDTIKDFVSNTVADRERFYGVTDTIENGVSTLRKKMEDKEVSFGIQVSLGDKNEQVLKRFRFNPFEHEKKWARKLRSFVPKTKYEIDNLFWKIFEEWSQNVVFHTIVQQSVWAIKTMNNLFEVAAILGVRPDFLLEALPGQIHPREPVLDDTITLDPPRTDSGLLLKSGKTAPSSLHFVFGNTIQDREYLGVEDTGYDSDLTNADSGDHYRKNVSHDDLIRGIDWNYEPDVKTYTISLIRRAADQIWAAWHLEQYCERRLDELLENWGYKRLERASRCYHGNVPSHAYDHNSYHRESHARTYLSILGALVGQGLSVILNVLRESVQSKLAAARSIQVPFETSCTPKALRLRGNNNIVIQLHQIVSFS